MQDSSTAEVIHHIPPEGHFNSLSVEATPNMQGQDKPIDEQLAAMKSQMAREMTAIADKLIEAADQVHVGDYQRAAALATRASRLTNELAKLSRLVAFLS